MLGLWEITEGMALAVRIAEAYAAKYAPYAPKPDPGGYILRPQKVLAWREADFIHTPTRWTFENNQMAARLS